MRGLRILALLCVMVIGLSLVGFTQGKIAIVLDVGGRGDLSFNDMGFKGTDQAAMEFGFEMVEVQSATAADYLPNLRNLARTGEYELIIAVGFLLGDALGTVAQEFPEQKFAIIDVDYITGPNIANYVFAENEMSALIGALNAMVALQEGFGAAGVVLGIPIPVLFHFEAGYRFGMDWALKKYEELMGCEVGVQMVYNYTGTFSDIALGKAASEAMLAQGAVGIYNVAGPLGVGDLEAVTEYHANYGTTSGAPYYFGVDANQDWMGMAQHTLASGMKRVDLATYLAVKSVVVGTFTAGVTILDMANGGVAISKAPDLNEFIDFAIKGGSITEADRATIVANWNANRAGIPQFIWDAIDELEAGIIDGSITVPTANLEEEIQAIRAEYPLEHSSPGCYQDLELSTSLVATVDLGRLQEYEITDIVSPTPSEPEPWMSSAFIPETTDLLLALEYEDGAGARSVVGVQVVLDTTGGQLLYQGEVVTDLANLFGERIDGFGASTGKLLAFSPIPVSLSLLDLAIGLPVPMLPIWIDFEQLINELKAVYEESRAFLEDFWQDLEEFLEELAAKPYKTDKGKTVTTFDDGWPNHPDKTQDEADEALRRIGLKDKVEQTGPPTDDYDCHGWTFTNGDKWIDDDQVQKILDDNGYTKVAKPKVGDLVVYKDADGNIRHTGIVRKVDPETGEVTKVESKWGRYGRYKHAPNDVPSSYGTPEYYHTDREGGHTLGK